MSVTELKKKGPNHIVVELEDGGYTFKDVKGFVLEEEVGLFTITKKNGKLCIFSSLFVLRFEELDDEELLLWEEEVLNSTKGEQHDAQH